MVVNMAVNNSSLSLPMHEVNIDGIRLWSWNKVRYDSAAKLDTLRRYYGDNIRSIKMKFSGLLVKYID